MNFNGIPPRYIDSADRADYQQSMHKQAAQERAKEKIYEDQQLPFLEHELPQILQDFGNETLSIQNSEWEKDSFARAIVILNDLEDRFLELCGIGLATLFKATFIHQFTSYSDSLFSKISNQVQKESGNDRFLKLMQCGFQIDLGTLIKDDSANLKYLFKLDDHFIIMNPADDKVRAYNFLKNIRADSLK